jgi:hypothetical protein
MSKRSCGTCTKCCEGWLTTNVLGNSLYPGKPCHFISVGKGCTVYSQRPKDPCAVFKCGWLDNPELPEWFKPEQINAIIKFDKINGIPRMVAIEAGETLQSRVLTWLIQYAITNHLNFAWQINGSFNWIGSPEFHQEMESSIPNGKFLHSESNRLLPLVSKE